MCAIFQKRLHWEVVSNHFNIKSDTMVLRELTGYRFVLCAFFPADSSTTIVAFQGIN